MALDKSLDAITEDDLKGLIENHVLETKSLDYKLLLPTSRDLDKKEFLADVLSFANTIGGDILYGVAQDNTNGYPCELTGIDSPNWDQEILRLERTIRDGVEPRIPSIQIQLVPLSNSKKILILRIKKSWLSPHRIKFNGDHRFYARGTNGKYELDVGELRTEFTLQEGVKDRIRRFREDRISKLIANDTPVTFEKGAKLVIHLIPLNTSAIYDIDRIVDNLNLISPLNGGSLDFRYNLDGYLIYAVGASRDCYSYTQIYRNGIIELVDASYLDSPEKIIASTAYETDIIKALPRYLTALQKLGVELPIAIFLTLTDVKGCYMATVKFFEEKGSGIDREILQLPEVIIDTYTLKAESILKPIFDTIWNSCGFRRSLNYDDDGTWNPKRREYRRS
jgi:hypothetical protein